MKRRFQRLVQWLGRAGVAFVVTFVSWLLLTLTGTLDLLRAVFLLGMLVTGAWVSLRVFRWLGERAVWRLRHRLMITYLFIAVAPVVLLVVLGSIGVYSLMLQAAMNVVTTELEHREAELSSAAEAIGRLDAPVRSREMVRLLDPYFTRRYAGLAVVLHQSGVETRFPLTAVVPPPAAKTAGGVVQREGRLFLWAYRKTDDGDVTITAPLSRWLLDQLAPELGIVDAALDRSQLPASSAGAGSKLPPAAGGLDAAFVWVAFLRTAEWEKPAEQSREFVLGLETRISAVAATVFNRDSELSQGLLQGVLLGGLVIFILVEIVCWAIGVTMTRTITGAVHHLYEGTRNVMEGKFSHRMPVHGRDQLAEVGMSFNRMTVNLEQLVDVAKEKERLHSEIVIAQEVQNQLYPKLQTRSSHLRVAAAFRPARLVSGDYFDYESTPDGKVAICIGDVAGKGISAALLMASIQSSLRTQLGHGGQHSPAEIVARLNSHLCASTSTEKYATFCLGLYDESSGRLTYTNAGHIPPILIRAGKVHRLDVNGTVVGAFAFAKYDQSCIELESGDLLALPTDGLTEPENQFGEMFGEERFIDLVARNSQKTEQEIVDRVLDEIRQWTGSDELQDDITLLLVRRV
ncbi:MAG: SpoIIE family protein phosphatase [Bryobacteraceae bacterium]